MTIKIEVVDVSHGPRWYMMCPAFIGGGEGCFERSGVRLYGFAPQFGNMKLNGGY